LRNSWAFGTLSQENGGRRRRALPLHPAGDGIVHPFRLWQAKLATTESSPQTQDVPLSTALLLGEGTARWRMRLKEANRDHVIVFLDDAYGIFHLAELAVLSGLRLRRLPASLASSHDILLRYGISP